jgi:hypothetical protein
MTIVNQVPCIPTAAKRCTCGHLEPGHDAEARRYCAATSSAALTRGCICRVSPPKPNR